MAETGIGIPVTETLATALAHLRAGRGAQAERLYRRVLAADPDQPDALHYLGVIAHQAGRHDRACVLIGRAATLRPEAADIRNNLGEAWRAAGRLGEAEPCFRQALALKPAYASAMNNLGNVLLATRRLAEAEQNYRSAVALEPAYAEAWNNLGGVLRMQRRDVEAEAPYRRALALRADYPDAQRNLAELLRATGRGDEAAGLSRQARAVELETLAATLADRLARADEPEARYRLAGVLSELGRSAEAAVEYERVIAVVSGRADVHNDYGNCLRRLGRDDEAGAQYRRALALQPDIAEVHNNLANLMRDRGDPAGAERAYARAIVLKPELVMAYANLGSLLADAGRNDEADEVFARALALRPDDAMLAWNYSLFRLHCGDFAKGFLHYERRFDAGDDKAFGAARRVLASLGGIARWRGESLEGRSLLVWTEQGLGDSVLFMRFFQELKARGLARLLVYCEPALVRLFQAMPAVDEAVTRDGPPPFGRFDLHCPIMSLPLLLGTRLETLTAEVPCAPVPEALDEAWRVRVADLPRPRVGIAWRSGTLSTAGAVRDIPLEGFAPILAVPGISFVSLQKGEAAGDIVWLGLPVADAVREARDLLDTGALMRQLDLIVTIDTVIPHLAGTLARPVWLLNRHESDWRWLRGRRDSPWYPTLRIYTQPARGDWEGAIAEVARDLAAWRAAWQA
jgi:Tfp pilus assembly protein PilF